MKTTCVKNKNCIFGSKDLIKNRGFTLFELLVTISIISILTAVAVVSYGGLNKKTRDSRRIADIEKIRIALEAARQIGNTYPPNLNGLVTGKFLDQVPVDPKTKVAYSFNRLTTYTYRLCANVENAGSISSDVSGCTGLPSGFAGYYKAVQP